MPQFSILSPQEVESLHHATLRILSEAGFQMTHAGARRGRPERERGQRAWSGHDTGRSRSASLRLP